MYDSYVERTGVEPETVWDGCLPCPRCGNDNTHVATVRVAARVEDGPVTFVRVNGYTGRVDNQRSSVPDPRRSARQQIALEGSCEAGCMFAYIVRQDHGRTYLDVATGLGTPCVNCGDLTMGMLAADGRDVCSQCEGAYTDVE